MGQSVPVMSDHEAKMELARELAEQLPLHDPDFSIDVAGLMLCAYGERRVAAGLVTPPEKTEAIYDAAGRDVE